MRPAAPADLAPFPPSPAAHPSQQDLAIGLVYLDRWPALPQQLTDSEILVNRICTLLSKKPRSSHLIHLLLRAPKNEVQIALRMLLQTGCIHIGQASTVPGTGNRPLVTAAPPDTPLASQRTRPAPSARKAHSAAATPNSLPAVLGKIWQRLSS